MLLRQKGENERLPKRDKETNNETEKKTPLGSQRQTRTEWGYKGVAVGQGRHLWPFQGWPPPGYRKVGYGRP
jgi:hypothetical protein